MYYVVFCRLKIVFPWFLTSFVGYLSVEQIFILWDFIIGYDSLEILAGNGIISAVIHTMINNDSSCCSHPGVSCQESIPSVISSRH